MRTASAWLLTSQYEKARRLRGLIDAQNKVAKQEQDDAYDAATLMGSLDDAEGVWLDLIGKRLGCYPRPQIQNVLVTDDEYRTVLRALGRVRRSDGSLPDFEEAVVLALREGISTTDNQDMTVTIVIGAAEERAALLALACGALGLPAGVRLIIENTSAQVSDVVAAAGDREVDLTWTAPAGAVIVRYRIQWKSGAQEYSSAREATPAGDAVAATIDGLMNGSAYTFRIRAEAAVGNGAWSDEVTATPVAAPGRVTGLAGAGSAGQMALSWIEPSDNGSPILRYRVQWKSGAQAYGATREATSAHLTHTVMGLASGTEYDFRVRAENAIGNGDWSAEFSGTPATEPGRVTGLDAVAGDRRATLGYTAPASGGSPILRYRIQWRSGGQGYSSSRDTTRVGLQAVIQNLSNGTAYTFRVRAENDVGNGDWSDEVSATPVAVPGQVSGAVTNASAGQVGLGWLEPDDGGSEITRYRVQWKSGAQQFGTDPDRETTVETASAAIQNLDNGTEYNFRVRAENDVGEGDWSAEVSATPVAAPDQVTGLVFVGGSDFSVSRTIEWDAPNANGSPILRYRVQKDQNVLFQSVDEEITTSALTVTMDTPTRDRHSFRVRAENDVGEGVWSDVLSE